MKQIPLVLLHADGSKQAADGIDHAALATNHLAQVIRMDGYFKGGTFGTLSHANDNILRMINQGPNDVLHQFFHKTPQSSLESQVVPQTGNTHNQENA